MLVPFVLERGQVASLPVGQIYRGQIYGNSAKNQHRLLQAL